MINTEEMTYVLKFGLQVGTVAYAGIFSASERRVKKVGKSRQGIPSVESGGPADVALRIAR